MSLVAAVLLGLALPILPVQILPVNMVSSVALVMVVAFEPSEHGVMQRAPRVLLAVGAVLLEFEKWVLRQRV